MGFRDWKMCECANCREHGKSHQARKYAEEHGVEITQLRMLESEVPSLEEFIIKWADIRKDGK